MIPRSQCIVCHGSGTMPDLEDTSKMVECEFCEEYTVDREKTVQYTTRQLKEIHLALFYKQILGGYGTDGHHRLMLIADSAEREGCRLVRGGNEIETPPHWVEVQEPRRQ